MSIQKISQNYTTQILKNKTLLKGLEKISEHGTSFTAGTSLIMSLSVRLLAINSTPDVEKENKQYAMANSICSGLIKFGMVEAIALPIEKAVKNIDNNPQKFLKNSKHFAGTKAYKLVTQMFKLGTGFLMAIPKSMLTIALIPVIMDKLFNQKEKTKLNTLPQNTSIQKKNKNTNFTGNFTNTLSKGIGKILDNKDIQNLARKFQNKDKDIAKHISAGTDILLTSSFAYQTAKSDKIKENRKKALIYNNVISTGITLGLGYGIDNIIKKNTNKFIDKFKQINLADPKLQKYVEGINILRPAVIFAVIYYGILPMFSTYMAERIDKFIEKQNKPKTDKKYGA